MNEALSLYPILLLPPENPHEGGGACPLSTRSPGPYTWASGPPQSTSVRVTQHLPNSLANPSPCLGDSPWWLTSVKHQKHVKQHATAVTRANSSHLYFRNLELWHEQGFQSFKNMPCLSLCPLVCKIQRRLSKHVNGVFVFWCFLFVGEQFSDRYL